MTHCFLDSVVIYTYCKIRGNTQLTKAVCFVFFLKMWNAILLPGMIFRIHLASNFLKRVCFDNQETSLWIHRNGILEGMLILRKTMYLIFRTCLHLWKHIHPYWQLKGLYEINAVMLSINFPRYRRTCFLICQLK